MKGEYEKKVLNDGTEEMVDKFANASLIFSYDDC